MIHVFDRLIKRSQRQLHNRLMRNLSSYCTHRYFGCLLTSRLWKKCKYSSFTLILVTIWERTKCAQLAFGLVALQYLGIFQKSDYRGIQNHYITAARKYFIVHIIYLLLLLFPICKNKGTEEPEFVLRTSAPKSEMIIIDPYLQTKDQKHSAF